VVRRRPPARQRRSRLRTSLTLVAAVGGLAVLVGIVGALWGLWSFARINRVDLELEEAARSAPRNFLVVGSDSREGVSSDDPDAGGMLGPGAPSGRRADSIMIARVDPAAERVDLLSVPRDLWVPIAGAGEEQRINTAYSKSAQAVVDTVRDVLGVPIHHFVEVDFGGFQTLIDALDGVPMYFDNPVRDANSGLNVPRKGCTVLDGRQGLAFARARHLEWSDGSSWRSDGTGDLGRSNRQQLLTRAAMARAQDMGLGDVGKLRRLVDASIGAVTLDGSLGAGDLIDLGRRLSEVDPDRMQTHGLPVTAHRTSGGASVVLLDRAAAGPVLEVFRGDLSRAPVTTTTTPPPSPDEVTVDVLNGSGLDGEARRVGFVLASAGFVSGRVDTASEVSRTTVSHRPGGKQMAALVAGWLHPSPEIVEDDEVPAGAVRVTLGRDFDSVYEPSTDPDPPAAPTPETPTPPAAGATPVTVTTTTQPGWVPGTPPAGVSCR
jgi:polyisoprenyl-teichoic acid--peptidoglycan teichoic acid transferase